MTNWTSPTLFGGPHTLRARGKLFLLPPLSAALGSSFYIHLLGLLRTVEAAYICTYKLYTIISFWLGKLNRKFLITHGGMNMNNSHWYPFFHFQISMLRILSHVENKMLWGENSEKWKGPAVARSWTQDTSGLSRQCSATTARQPPTLTIFYICCRHRVFERH